MKDIITTCNKREIEIRRLVGASNSFIRQPFFFEGIILGVFGSIIPIIICCYGYKYLYDRLGGQLFTAIIKLATPASIVYKVMGVIVVVAVVAAAAVVVAVEVVVVTSEI